MYTNWINPRNSVQPTHLVVVPNLQQGTWPGLNPTPPVYNYNNINPPFTTSNQMGYQHNQVAPAFANPMWVINEQSDADKSTDESCSCCGIWCVLGCVIVSVILAGIIIGIVLSLELNTTTTTLTTTTATTQTTTSVTTSTTTSETTTSTTTTATTTLSCASPNTVGQIFSIASISAPATYTLYTYGFTANDSSATLTFAINGDSGPAQQYWLLDSVCANDTNTNTNVLINGDFELGSLTGWTQYCATDANCGVGDYGQITTSSCYSGSYCYVDKCSSTNHFDYLTQSFPTTIGDYYIISFYLKIYTTGGPHWIYVMLT